MDKGQAALYQQSLEAIGKAPKQLTPQEPEEESHLGRDLAVGAGSWFAADLAVKGIGAGMVATGVGAPVGAFLLSPGGSVATKAVKLAVTSLAASPIFDYITGWMDNKPNDEILKNLPTRLLEDQIFMFGLGMTGAALSKSGKVVKGMLPLNWWEDKVGKPVWEALSKVANYKFVDKIVAPSVAEGVLKGRRSLAEIFQPALERLPLSQASQMRKVEVSRSLARYAGRAMGEKLNLMGIDERFAFYSLIKKGTYGAPSFSNKFFTNLPDDSKGKVLDALAEIPKWMKTTAERNKFTEAMRKESFTENLEKIFGKSITTRGSRFDYKYYKELQKLSNRENIAMGDVQKGLKELINHPDVSPQGKSLAKDLYLLSHTTLDSLPHAAKIAEEEALAMKLIKTPGFVSMELKPGYQMSKQEGFRGLYIPRDAELALQDINYVPKISQSLYNRFFLAPWKMGKVVLNPPSHVRNTLSNMIQNDWGGLPIQRVDIYYKSVRDLKQKTPQARRFLRELGEDVTFAGEEFFKFPTKVLGAESNAMEMGADYLSNLAKKVTNPFAKAYQWEELWSKYAKYLHNVERGMGHREAMTDAVKWTFNYGEVTPAVRWLRSSLIPFATWTTKILPLMAETAVKHPIRFGKWAAVPSAMTALAIQNMGPVTEEEFKELHKRMPDYYKNGMYSLIPFRDSQGRMMVHNWTWMLPGVGDLHEVGDSWPAAATGNPFVGLAADIGRNKTFSGAPIWYEWEEPQIKLWRALTHSAVQLAPSLIGSSLVDLNKTINGEEGSRTYGQQVWAQGFGKVSPLEPSKITRQWIGKYKGTVSQIRSRMLNDLRNAKSDDKREQIVKRYTGLLQKAIQEQVGSEE